jgi:histidine ammonia-lyase
MKHECLGIELSGQPLGYAEMVTIGTGKAKI